MSSTISDGIRIEYDDQGQGGPAALFLPGWCATRRAFDALLPMVASTRRALAMDWRGHGGSGPPAGDFDFEALVDDAVAVIDASGVGQVIPVATAHAGWVAIALRQRLGPRVPRLILVDWIVTPAPPPFRAGLAALQDPERFRAAIDGLFASWLEGVTHDEVIRFVREDMASFPFDMWRRGGREITVAYDRHESPLAALSALAEPVPTLHVYAQPADPGYLEMQRNLAASHPWFEVVHLDARSHFPTIEVPGAMVSEIERFARGTSQE